MKKSIMGMIIILVFACLGLFSSPLVNPQNPKKGNWNAKLKPIWQTENAGQNPLVRIFPLKINDNGNIYVIDQKFKKIIAFSPAGKFLLDFGKTGEGPGEYKFAMDIFFVKDRLVLVDLGKIHYYTLAGKYEKSYKIENQAGDSPLFFLDENRYVYTPKDPRKSTPPDRIEIFDVIKNEKKTLIDLSPGDDKDLSSASGDLVIIRLGPNELQRKTGLVVGLGEKSIYYGQNDQYLIKEIDLNGKETMSFSLENRPLKKITQEFKEKLVKDMRIVVEGGPSEDEIRKRFIKEIPDYCTYFWRIQKLNNGLILVFVSDQVCENGVQVDIFSSKGEYLYKMDIQIPEAAKINANVLQITDSHLYAFYEDNDGDSHLAKYEISLPQAD